MTVDIGVLAVLVPFVIFPMVGFLVLDRMGRVPERQRASGLVTATLATIGIGVVLTLILWGWDIGEGGAWALAIAWVAAEAGALWLVRRFDL